MATVKLAANVNHLQDHIDSIGGHRDKAEKLNITKN